MISFFDGKLLANADDRSCAIRIWNLWVQIMYSRFTAGYFYIQFGGYGKRNRSLFVERNPIKFDWYDSAKKKP
jgi:hypothetical protein